MNKKNASFLFSVGSKFSFIIDQRYYKGTHFVWCTTEFDRKGQPITSNPMSICKRYLEQILTGDRHTVEIKKNIAGIIRGAQEKLDEGIINNEQFDEICSLANLTRYEDFFPIIYIIDKKKVGKERCIEIEKEKRASDDSIEFLITNLSAGEYDTIDLQKLLSDMIDAVDEKAGE